MSDIFELVAAIDRRLADLAADITVLEAARAALDGPRSGGRVAAVATNGTTSRSRPRSTRRRQAPQPAAEKEGVRTRKRATTKPAANAARSRRAEAVVDAVTLARFLANASTGLSATAIAEQVGAGYDHTVKLLSELELAGQVRRSGSRRTTAWSLITDEERIAERSVKLERRRSAPGQRRGRARAS